MKLTMSPAADLDLNAVGTFIGTDDPVRASSFTRELFQACMALADTPLAYQVVGRHGDGFVRRKPHGRYLIFYRVSDGVEIVRILQGSRDVERLLFSEER